VLSRTSIPGIVTPGESRFTGEVYILSSQRASKRSITSLLLVSLFAYIFTDFVLGSRTCLKHTVQRFIWCSLRYLFIHHLDSIIKPEEMLIGNQLGDKLCRHDNLTCDHLCNMTLTIECKLWLLLKVCSAVLWFSSGGSSPIHFMLMMYLTFGCSSSWLYAPDCWYPADIHTEGFWLVQPMASHLDHTRFPGLPKCTDLCYCSQLHHHLDDFICSMFH